MFNKFEIFGALTSVFFMALAIYLVQVNSSLSGIGQDIQAAQVIEAQNPGVEIVSTGDGAAEQRANAYLEAADGAGNIERMVIDDVKIGTGEEVVEGDTVAVHYIGTLQNGQEFDNSKKRGEPFEFTVGEGRVIAGWEEGLIGMKTGGQRVLVIPPEKAYGSQGVGPIPADATLIFAIELVEIK